jgi:phage N-6-adenine-methyltransferase
MKQPRLLAVGRDKDERPTPQAFFDELHSEFGFTLDAAAGPENHKCPDYFTVEDDGLMQPWRGVVWCNPPYSEVGLWVQKAYEESKRGVTSVLLLPASTDTAWFHDYAWPHSEIRFVRGRLKFVGQDSPAPFGSMVCIFRGKVN